MKLTKQIADRLKKKYKLKGFVYCGEVNGLEYYNVVRTGFGGASGLPMFLSLDKNGSEDWVRNVNQLSDLKKHFLPVNERDDLYLD